MKNIIKITSIFSVLFCLASASVSADVIRHNKIGGSAKDDYQLGILKLALSYSKTQYEFEESPVPLTQTKLLADLDSNKMDVAWVGTSTTYEENFLPIRIPLFKGLLGHRIFLIRKGDQSSFNGVRNLEDLKQLKGGQVGSWTDTKILKDAGLNIVTTSKFNNLFYMLDGSRFDYFPRSVYSPWSDMANHPDLPFEVEKNILIVYPLPAYIFVNKDNIKLKNEILSGMNKAINDGSYNDFFYNYPLIKEGLANTKLEERTIFRIGYGDLHPDTPLDDERLWFNVEEYLSQQNQPVSEPISETIIEAITE